MCFQVTCKSCGKASWQGCGFHVPSVMDSTPEKDRCTCEPQVEKSGKMYPPKGGGKGEKKSSGESDKKSGGESDKKSGGESEKKSGEEGGKKGEEDSSTSLFAGAAVVATIIGGLGWLFGRKGV